MEQKPFKKTALFAGYIAEGVLLKIHKSKHEKNKWVKNEKINAKSN